MGGCCDDFVPGGGAQGGGGGGGITAAILSLVAGTAIATGPLVSFGNGSGVSFGITGNTITASVIGPDAGIGLSAGTQVMATGTVIFSNANGVSFGLNNSTLTASVAAIKTISAGTTNAQGPGLSFANGGGISFGFNGNTLTASVASQVPETPFAISGGAQSVSTGTVIFSNANNVSFGMAGNQTMTASASVAAIKTISAGTTNATGQGISFADGNGISFGLNGNTFTASLASSLTAIRVSAGTSSANLSALTFSNLNNVSFGLNGSVLTGSIPADVTVSQFIPYVGKIVTDRAQQNGTFYIAPYNFPNHVAFSQFNALLNFSVANSATGTVSMTYLVALYTKNVSSLSAVISTSFSSTMNYSSNASASLWNGNRVVTVPWTSSVSRGDYWVGIAMSSATSSQDASLRLLFQEINTGGAFAYSGLWGQASNASLQMQLGFGNIGTALASTIPASIAISDIRGSALGIGAPAFAFGQTV